MLPDSNTITNPAADTPIKYEVLLKKVEDHVTIFYKEQTDINLFYHNYAHTLEVINNTKLIANHYQLDDRMYFNVCAAACFHDTGYHLKNNKNHEQKSVDLAQAFLKTIGIEQADIEVISNCIMATKMPQMPKTLAEEIICDADLFNLGTNSFKETNKLLKREEEAFENKMLDGFAWRASSIRLLENHTYHTDYCRLLLNKNKEENLKLLKERQEKKEKKEKKAALVESIKNSSNDTSVDISSVEENKKTLKVNKKNLPLKGIETMFKISASKNIRISEMADSKAHIMISVNSIIISVVLGLTIKNLDEHRNLIVPTIILLAVNLTTIIYSVLATRPKIADGFFTKADVDNKSVNLLYFGSYYNMNFKEYHEGLKAMMADKEFLYGTLTKDTFWQGKVLGRKYRLLRTSYTIFLYGIVTAVAAFAIAVIFFS
jgi:predicted metal-dependent HD superfamily phosphohydrolase